MVGTGAGPGSQGPSPSPARSRAQEAPAWLQPSGTSLRQDVALWVDPWVDLAQGSWTGRTRQMGAGDWPSCGTAGAAVDGPGV